MQRLSVHEESASVFGQNVTCILSLFTINGGFAVVFSSQLISVIDKFGYASWISAVYLFVCFFVGYYKDSVDDSGE